MCSYMSPEVFTRYDVSPALDVYSFGIIGERGSRVQRLAASMHTLLALLPCRCFRLPLARAPCCYTGAARLAIH